MVYYVLMGLFDRFITNNAITPTVDVAAANTPYIYNQLLADYFMAHKLQLVSKQCLCHLLQEQETLSAQQLVRYL